MNIKGSIVYISLVLGLSYDTSELRNKRGYISNSFESNIYRELGIPCGVNGNPIALNTTIPTSSLAYGGVVGSGLNSYNNPSKALASTIKLTNAELKIEEDLRLVLLKSNFFILTQILDDMLGQNSMLAGTTFGWSLGAAYNMRDDWILYLEVVEILYKCKFLIRSHFYCKYNRNLRLGNLGECYNIILQSIRLSTNAVFYYNFVTTRFSTPGCSVSKNIAYFDTTNQQFLQYAPIEKWVAGIVSADFLYDFKTVLGFNILERIFLIKALIYQYRPSNVGYNSLNTLVLTENFIDLYKRIYYKANPEDIQFTTVILSLLYSTLHNEHCNTLESVQKLNNHMERYLQASYTKDMVERLFKYFLVYLK